MTEARPVDLVLMWHMHQPDYRDYATGEFRLPWVYLHAIKDYTDMAWHLEQIPQMRAVVNFTPVLLDQVEDYAEQFASKSLRDPLLRLLMRDDSRPLTTAEREFALDRCFHANHHKMIAPFPAYKRLHDLFVSLEPHGAPALAYLSDQYIDDLVTWYHLSWTGETLRRECEALPRLMAKASGFSPADRFELAGLIGGWIAGLVPRYRRLAAEGRVELSTTPHSHPLAPLLIDFGAAREAQPGTALPAATEYPGGRERVAAHLNSALESHARRFASPPTGLWPAEGAISAAFIRMLAKSGVTWAASSEAVLANSLQAQPGRSFERVRDLYRPWRAPSIAPEVTLFFRNDHISDLIGFQYATWHGSDAAANLIHEVLAAGAGAPAHERPLVSVILDGENAWESYPYNAFYFLSSLYAQLAAHPSVRTCTFSGYLSERAQPRATDPAEGELAAVVAGSWVYGNLSTWIGSPEKNRAWELLAAAKQGFNLVIASRRLSPEREAEARRQLADCESSDWFWWFGDYNPAEAVISFDQLYRAKLANLYRLLEIPAPLELGEPIGRGSAHAEGSGTMRRST